MPFDGSGVFVPIAAPDYPAVPNTLIRAAQFNNNLTDLFNGLTTCITRNGQSPAQANLPMAGFRHTGAGDAVAAGQYLVYGQTHPATTIDGNLTLQGNGRRIIADFSSATIANRGALQTSVTNGATRALVIPNGTSTVSTLYAANSSTPENASWLGLAVSNTTATLDSTIAGTGTFLPLAINVAGGTRLLFGTDGTINAQNIFKAKASTTGEASLNIAPGVAPTSPANGDLWLTSQALYVRLNSGTYPLGFQNIPRVATTGGNAGANIVGSAYATTGGITIPNSVFVAGDSFMIYNDSGASVTITQGAGVTLRLSGTATTGNRTLSSRGIASVWFNSASECIISGDVT